MNWGYNGGPIDFHKGLGPGHSVSHHIGRRGDLRAYHGTLKAVIRPTVLGFTEPACADKYARLRLAMGLDAGADLAAAVAARNAAIGLPAGLAAMGVTAAMIPDLVPYAIIDLAHFGNPRNPGAPDYAALFEQAL